MMVAGVILLLRGDAGNVTVITYGSPRCVGEQNVRAYLGRTVVNYRAYGDPVWTLPPTGEDWVSAVDAVSQWKGNNDAGKILSRPRSLAIGSWIDNRTALARNST